VEAAVGHAQQHFHNLIVSAIDEFGMTYASAFAHFDVLGLGMVRQEDFAKGLQVSTLLVVTACC
jgi:hypothetical protein